jgi:hypothetical protein
MRPHPCAVLDREIDRGVFGPFMAHARARDASVMATISPSVSQLERPTCLK